MKDLTRHLGESTDISMFTSVEEISSSSLNEGSVIQITYSPDRRIVMTYEGDCWFVVAESVGSKLYPDDRVRITQFVKDFESLATDVIRDGKNLGSYHAARDGGLTAITFIE